MQSFRFADQTEYKTVLLILLHCLEDVVADISPHRRQKQARHGLKLVRFGEKEVASWPASPQILRMKFLPSHKIYVERFFREGWQRKQALRSNIDEIYATCWQGKPRPNVAGLIDFAAMYERAVTEAGAFAAERNAPIERLKVKTTKPYEFSAFVLFPITVAQPIHDGSLGHTQDFMMLNRVGTSIAINKVIAHQSPLGLYFSKHALERFCERGENSPDVESLVVSNAISIAQRLTLLQFSGVVKFASEQGDWGAVSAFVPFLGGMMIFSSHYLSGMGYDENLGWKFNFTKNRYSYRYLKPELILPETTIRGGVTTYRTWYAATYVGSDQLSSAQRDYVRAVDRVFASTSQATFEATFKLQLDPDTVSRADRYAGLGSEIDPAALSSALALLDGPAFQVPDRVPAGLLVEDRTNTEDLRTVISANDFAQ